MYIDHGIKVKNYVQHLIQILTIINDLVCTRDLSVTGPLHPFEARDVLFMTWKTGSPDQLEERWTRPWDVLLTTPTALKLAGIRPWAHHTRVKRAPEEEWTVEPKEDLKVVPQR